MLAFMWWMVIGLVAGLFARLFMPGRQSMGLFMTMLLGLAGSIVGGFISSLLFGYPPNDPHFHAGGLVMSTIGALILLGISVSRSNPRRFEAR